MNSPASLIKKYCDQIHPGDQAWLSAARERQLTLTKPPGSLGRLEEMANRLAAIQRTATPVVTKNRIYVVAGDHGVTIEGVSAYPREVTPQMLWLSCAACCGQADQVSTRKFLIFPSSWGGRIRIVRVRCKV